MALLHHRFLAAWLMSETFLSLWDLLLEWGKNRGQSLADCCVNALSSAQLSVHLWALLLFDPSVMSTVLLSSPISCSCSIKSHFLQFTFLTKWQTYSHLLMWILESVRLKKKNASSYLSSLFVFFFRLIAWFMSLNIHFGATCSNFKCWLGPRHTGFLRLSICGQLSHTDLQYHSTKGRGRSKRFSLPRDRKTIVTNCSSAFWSSAARDHLCMCDLYQTRSSIHHAALQLTTEASVTLSNKCGQ